MKPQPWRYKLGLALYAVAWVVMCAHTVNGLGNWAWHKVVPADTSIVEPSESDTAPQYRWPH